MLGEMLRDFCSLYNAALEERIDAYRKYGISRTYKDQALELKAVRTLDVGLERWSFSAEQQVLRRLDKSFKAFFRRCKGGQKPGFPRFRASVRYHAAEFRVGDGLTLRKSNRVGIVGIPGEVKCKSHRELPSDPTSAILIRQNGKWDLKRADCRVACLRSRRLQATELSPYQIARAARRLTMSRADAAPAPRSHRARRYLR